VSWWCFCGCLFFSWWRCRKVKFHIEVYSWNPW